MMFSTIRYHVGHNVPGQEPEFGVECIADQIDAAEWQAYDAESMATYYRDLHAEECGTSPQGEDAACGCTHYAAYLQAQELTERCEKGEFVPAFRIGEEDWWMRPVVGCGCPCDCEDPCDGDHIHAAIDKITN
ncbi:MULTISPECIES: hypothetical protein [unclassified Streptomyces]|uniref:hypothetical protein n=1 Tax=unclassified Streptomyces TaxID=2593676 RepID=UPI00089B4D26|nr:MULTISPECIES: hypothetical protein [unclassified Streptomyces]PBC84616.1 hypothetical protein BX261_4610 [Streptomyces sp. 2321.6]SED38028.1 hypothetical protein SAMN05428940_4638 [Streptomyces sp. 2133.1]